MTSSPFSRENTPFGRWLASVGRSYASVAEQARGDGFKATASHIRNIAIGAREPSYKLALFLVAMTAGRVTMADLKPTAKAA